MPLELLGNPVGHRHSTARAPGLRSALKAAHVVTSYTYRARTPIHVLPLQRQQFPLAQAGHGRDQDYRPVSRPAQRVRPLTGLICRRWPGEC